MQGCVSSACVMYHMSVLKHCCCNMDVHAAQADGAPHGVSLSNADGRVKGFFSACMSNIEAVSVEETA